MDAPYGFFGCRQSLDFGIGGETSSKHLNYKNVPQAVAMVVSSRMATLYELDTVYGIEDMYDMLEILSVDAFNSNNSVKT